jgi:hypothetical protein
MNARQITALVLMAIDLVAIANLVNALVPYVKSFAA